MNTMDRRNFLAASIGFLGCAVLRLDIVKGDKIIQPPKLLVRQAGHDPHNLLDLPPGIFYLSQPESGMEIALSKRVDVKVLDYREKVAIYEYPEKSIDSFVCYDKDDPEFKRIKEGSRKKGVRHHTFEDEVGRVCYWCIESLIKVDGHEATLNHRGKHGLQFVLDVPVGSIATYGVKEFGVPEMGLRYVRQLLLINGEPVARFF
jgi:hypothetical protein